MVSKRDSAVLQSSVETPTKKVEAKVDTPIPNLEVINLSNLNSLGKRTTEEHKGQLKRS